MYFIFIKILNFCITKSAYALKDPKLELQVPILEYKYAQSFPEYLGKLIEYALYILIPLAIIIIMYGGFQWIMNAGNAPKIEDAKSYIVSAFTGLIIALLTINILSIIGITELKMQGIQYIKEIESPDLEDPAPLNFDVASANNSAGVAGEIYCPKSGGYDEMPKIAKSTLGKVTYRMGGKAWNKAPYGDKKSCGSRPCKEFCPEKQLCMDCSGYVAYIYMCAGIKAPPAYTGTMFGCNCGVSEKITTYTATSVNGKELQPGDYVGYPSGCNFGTGHVYIYGGNGKIYESHGGGGTQNANSGRIPGKAILETAFNGHQWTGKPQSRCIQRRGAQSN